MDKRSLYKRHISSKKIIDWSMLMLLDFQLRGGLWMWKLVSTADITIFGRFQSRGLCLIRKKMDFRCISAPSWWDDWREHTSGVFERILMLIWKICVWFWGRIGICSVYFCLLFNHIKYSYQKKKRQEKPHRVAGGDLHMAWSGHDSPNCSWVLPGFAHRDLVIVFLFAHSLIALSKSKLPISWCCYPILIGPEISEENYTQDIPRLFFLQLGGVRFDPGYDLSCGWFASIWSFTVNFVTKVA